MKHQVLIIGLIMMLIISNSNAATFCVTNETQLRDALADAESNTSFDTIKIQTGDYFTQGNEFSFDDDSGNGLEISGGWSFLQGAGNCAAQLSNNVLDTTIDGSSLSAAMSISLSDAADFSISKLTFVNAISGDAALSVRKFNVNGVYQGHYVIEKNIFINNETSGIFGSALAVRGADLIEIRNNLYYQNLGENRVIDVSNPLGVEIYITNNTIYKNDGRLWVEIEGSSEMLIANNVIRENEGFSDFSVVGSGTWYLYNNNLGNYSSTPNLALDNLNLPSRFVDPINLDFRPDVASPLIDNGFLPCAYTTLLCVAPLPFQHDWDPVTLDLMGSVRIQNDKIEIGAFEVSYESDLIFMNIFD